MPFAPRLWRNFASWFKSNNGHRASPRRSRREQCSHRRPFSIEQFEPRQLLASDIALTDFGATGTHLVVAYDIAEETAPAFNVSVYRSTDGITRDALVGTRAVTLDQERTVGSHAVGVGVSLDNLREDYRLIAVVDALNEVAEASEENNEIAFRGGAFLTPDGTLHVHGGNAADMVRIDVAEPAHGSGSGATGSAGAITVKINEWTLDYDTDTLREIHVRLHGGDDVLNVHPQVTHSIHAYGGAGNDRILSGAGSDWLIGGMGDDFIAGRGNRDWIDGGDGNDTLMGGADQDTILGNTGDDSILGGGGRDIVDGGKGSDIVDGGQDDDLVFGGRGADRIVNPPGRDESRDAKTEDTLLLTTPEELLFAELSAEEDGNTAQSASLMSAESDETYGYADYAGPFWLEPEYGHTYYQPEGNEEPFTPFTIQRAAADIWGPSVDFDLAYYGAATSADFHSQKTSISFPTGYSGQSILVSVLDDPELEGTENFLVEFASAVVPSNPGMYIIIGYQDPQPPPSDPDGDPMSATAYIVDGDLEIWDPAPYPIAEADEEQPGVRMQVSELTLLNVTLLDLPGSYPSGYYTLDYPLGIKVWTDQIRSEEVPSGTEITESTQVFVEATQAILNAAVSLNWNYAWTSGVIDSVIVSAGPIVDLDIYHGQTTFGYASKPLEEGKGEGKEEYEDTAIKVRDPNGQINTITVRKGGAFTVANLNDTDDDNIVDSIDNFVTQYDAPIVDQVDLPAGNTQVTVSSVDGLKVNDWAWVGEIANYVYRKVIAINAATNVIQFDAGLPAIRQGFGGRVNHGRDEVDLMKIVVQHPGAGTAGNMELTVSGNLKLWKSPTKNNDPVQLTNNKLTIPINTIPANGLEYWVEVTAASAQIGDASVTLTYNNLSDRVNITGVWSSVSSRHDKGDQVWTVMTDPPGKTIENFGGFGLLPPTQVAGGANPGLHFNSGIGIQFVVAPAGIQYQRAVKFDATRIRETNVWQRHGNNPWGEIAALRTPFPRQSETPNDEPPPNGEFDGSTAPNSNGHFYAYDAPGFRIEPQPPQTLTGRAVRSNFLEWLRVSFGDLAPEGQGRAGSRMSPLYQWTSRATVVLNAGSWQRSTGDNNESTENHVKLGRDENGI